MNNDRFKFRVWGIEERRYCNEDEPMFLSESGEVNFWSFHELEVCDGVTVEQCTGVRDKAGVLIYEGDILKVPHLNSDGFVLVRWVNGSFMVSFRRTLSSLIEERWYVVVVGNIHENSDLLSGDDEGDDD